MFKANLRTKFHVPRSNNSLVIVIKTKRFSETVKLFKLCKKLR
jgi:hypothetical protein